ncbi:hypothetical protein CLV33_103109 [Jejuia pallidilutea]|uniref:Uncharacterized protein n=1 Tax=Jejuia pallidilutea TaxID=504487 RepID=A0A362XDH1_9FLAO|nr:hypothetical protein [Jejuia pallidilutea]PQV49478.1 hypothetical protein CLV33_103109 [Jejuia pallidilutea]
MLDSTFGLRLQMNKVTLYIYRLLGGFKTNKLLLFTFTFLVLNLGSFSVFANEKYSITNKNGKDKKKINLDDYEEIIILLKVKTLGNFEFDVYYSKEKIFIPISRIFNLLKVNYNYAAGEKTITGVFDNNKPYEINFEDDIIKIQNTEYKVPLGYLVPTGSDLALESELFAEAFGLNINFNFNGLYIDFEAPFELPIAKEKRLQTLRNNLEKLKNETPNADSTYVREHHILKGGIVNYTINATQSNGKFQGLNGRASLGTELLGGETNFNYNFNTNNTFNFNQVNFNWRIANDNNKFVKQLNVGNLSGSKITTMQSQLIGASITNAPIRQRSVYGETTITDFTEPYWTVELYINNTLISYVETDISGYYNFNIPLAYGKSEIKLRFYGPTGEERDKELEISIPNNLVPKGKIEYFLDSGLTVNDAAFFTHGELNYGFNRHLSLKGGLEYVSAFEKNKLIPFAGVSAIANANLFGNMEYVHKVGATFNLNCNINSQHSINFNYETYNPEQEVVLTPYNQRSRLMLNTPIFIKNTQLMMRNTFEQRKSAFTTDNSLQSELSFYKNRFSYRLTTFARWNEYSGLNMAGNLTSAIRLPKNIALRAGIAADIKLGTLQNMNVILEKKFKDQSELQITYQDGFSPETRMINLSYRKNIKKISTFLSTAFSKHAVSTSEGISGGFAFDDMGVLKATNNLSVGTGNIALVPFMDINHNGLRENDEPLVAGLNARIDNRILRKQPTDTILKITGLIPHISNTITLDDSSFENIFWKIKDKHLKVYIDPNQYKTIPVPVCPMGEVYGYAYYNKNNQLKAARGIIINILDEHGNKIAQTMTESDGYYAYLGLKPGNYTIEIDNSQLNKLNMKANTIRNISIKESIDGYSKGIQKLLLTEKISQTVAKSSW